MLNNRSISIDELYDSQIFKSMIKAKLIFIAIDTIRMT